MDRTTRGILEVARSVIGDLDLDVVLDRVLEAARELTEARYAALGVLNDTRTELARFITRGIDSSAHAAIGALPRGRGVLGVLIDEPAPVRLGDVGAHPLSYGFPHGHPPMGTFLGVPILVQDEPFGNLYLTEKAGGLEFSEADERAVVILAEFAGVAIDHARRFTGASERRDELERTVAALEVTTEIARAVGGETDAEVVLGLVAKRGRALVSARTLVIELIEGEDLVVAAVAGEMPAGLVGQRMMVADSLAGHAIRTHRPQRLEDQLNRARFVEHGLGSFGVDAVCGLVVPLIFRGETYGVLVALDRLDGSASFAAEDERLLNACATSAAMAVATAHSAEVEHHRQRLAAAEAERARWARELHDETLQGLSAMRIGLASAGRSEQPEALARAVKQTVEQLDDAIADLRALITDLRPAALDELGVQAALEALAERAARHGIEVDTSIDLSVERGQQSRRLAPELEIALYRVVQEALTNAIKHGQASRAVIEVQEHSGAVELSVRDDGIGFDPQARSDGFGVRGMHERIGLLRGELSIESTPGEGTHVHGHIPVRSRAGEVEERPVDGAASSAAGAN